MAMTPEAAIKRSICGALEIYARKHHLIFWVQESVGVYDAKKGVYRRKTSRWQTNGIADIIVIIKINNLSIPIFLEVKTDVGRQSEHQKAFQVLIESVNGFYFVVRSIDDAILSIDKVREIVDSQLVGTGTRGAACHR